MSTTGLLTVGGDTNFVLAVGGVNAIGTGAGLFIFDGEVIQRIDSLPSVGLKHNGQHLFRLLCSDSDPKSPGELFVYDMAGVERYIRVPNLADAHDLAWDGESIICTATANNSLLWLSPYGEHRNTWKAPGENDAWHLNGLWCQGGKTYLSAFGRFAQHREWNEDPFAHAGIIYNWSEQRVEVSGLDRPHNPVLLQEGWVICNSGLAELLNLDSSSHSVKRTLQLNGWTRGFACSDRYYFVGESADRKKLTAGASAHLCIVDRQTWEVRDRFAFPVTEITFVTLIPSQFVLALRRGFRTNPYREALCDGQGLLRSTGSDCASSLATMEPLPVEAFKSRISTKVPAAVSAGSRFRISLQVMNLGTGILVSYPPHPVHLTYTWHPLQNGVVEEVAAAEEVRSRLPQPVLPRKTVDCALDMVAPSAAGNYRLRVSLIQEGVARFEEVDSENAYEAIVRVQKASRLFRFTFGNALRTKYRPSTS